MTFEECLDYGTDLYEIDCKYILKVFDTVCTSTILTLIDSESLAAY